MPLVTRQSNLGNLLVQDTEPANPKDGDIWTDTGQNPPIVKVNDDGTFRPTMQAGTFVQGDTLFANANNTLDRLAKGTALQVVTMNSGATIPEWADAGGLTFGRVVKPTDESITNSITMQNDDDLLIALTANNVYSGILFLFVNANSSADFKYQITLPSGATGDKFNVDWEPILLSSTEDITNEVAVASGGTVQYMAIGFRVVMSTTAGNIQVQWAQNTSNAGATIMLQGSLLIIWEQ